MISHTITMPQTNCVITGFKKSGSALPYNVIVNEELVNNIAETYVSQDHTYVLTNNNELLRTISNININNSYYFDYEKIADNVVKCSENYYLTKDGNLYDFNGTLFKTGVKNVTDDTYTIENKWYKFDETEFKLNYATDYNVTMETTPYDITVSYGEDITSVTAPDGTALNSGDTYSYILEGIYVFTVTNSYGDTFEKSIYTKGCTLGLDAPGVNVLNGTIMFISEYDIQISEDGIVWTDYTSPIEYKNAIYYRAIDGNKTSDTTRARDELYVTGQYVAFGPKKDRTYNKFLKEAYDILEMEFNPIDPMEEIREAEKKEQARIRAAERRAAKRAALAESAGIETTLGMTERDAYIPSEAEKKAIESRKAAVKTRKELSEKAVL